MTELLFSSIACKRLRSRLSKKKHTKVLVSHFVTTFSDCVSAHTSGLPSIQNLRWFAIESHNTQMWTKPSHSKESSRILFMALHCRLWLRAIRLTGHSSGAWKCQSSSRNTRDLITYPHKNLSLILEKLNTTNSSHLEWKETTLSK